MLLVWVLILGVEIGSPLGNPYARLYLGFGVVEFYFDRDRSFEE